MEIMRYTGWNSYVHLIPSNWYIIQWFSLILWLVFAFIDVLQNLSLTEYLYVKIGYSDNSRFEMEKLHLYVQKTILCLKDCLYSNKYLIAQPFRKYNTCSVTDL